MKFIYDRYAGRHVFSYLQINIARSWFDDGFSAVLFFFACQYKTGVSGILQKYKKNACHYSNVKNGESMILYCSNSTDVTRFKILLPQLLFLWLGCIQNDTVAGMKPKPELKACPSWQVVRLYRVTELRKSSRSQSVVFQVFISWYRGSSIAAYSAEATNLPYDFNIIYI